MKVYRICSLSSDGEILLSFQLACPDDLAALSEAETISEVRGSEVWEGQRLVARVKPGNAALATEDRYSL